MGQGLVSEIRKMMPGRADGRWWERLGVIVACVAGKQRDVECSKNVSDCGSTKLDNLQQLSIGISIGVNYVPSIC